MSRLQEGLVPVRLQQSRQSLTRLASLLLAGAAFGAFPTTAFAQTPEVEESSAGGDIIVTARKREESVQDVPATINVLNGQDLADAGIIQPRELQFAVPGFYVQNFETRATITLRGIGSQIEGGQSSVATHVNGVYQASSAAQLNRLFDIERLEVVKGPQGTLYGRNSTGGALNIITRNARGDDFEGNVSAGYGSYNTIRLDGGVSLPLGSDWGIRVAGSYANGDPIYTNVVTNRKIGSEKFWGVRGTLSGNVGDLKIDLFGQYGSDEDTRNVILIPLEFGTKTPLLGFRTTAFDDPAVPATKKNSFVTGLTLELPLGGGLTARSITGYMDYSEPRSDTDINPRPGLPRSQVIAFPQAAKQFSQELQLLYDSDKLNGVLGVYYLNDKQTADRSLIVRQLNRVLLDSSNRDDVDALAVFADVNFDLTDDLTLNGGIRWNRDKIRNRFIGAGLFDGPPFDLDGKQSKVTWRAGLDYKITPNFLAYGSVSTGFLSGRFETSFDGLTGNSIPNEVKPENITAYEVGGKLALPNDIGFLNVAAFRYDYRNLQVTVGGLFLLPDGSPDPLSPPFFFTDNAAKSRISGFEFQLSEFRVSKFLKLDFNAAYINAKYRDFDAIDDFGQLVSFDGNTLPRSPKLTFSSAITLDNLAITDAAIASIRTEFNFRDKTFFTRENIDVSTQQGYGLLNVIAKIDFNDGQWGLNFAGRNLTNQKRFNFLRNDPFATVGEFRNFEVSLKYRF
jgi:iron complex outermembrane recepter protein